MDLETLFQFDFLPPEAYRLTEVSPWHGHIPFGDWCITQLNPRILVELGTHKGDSYFSFCECIRARSLSTQAFAVDTWKGEEHSGTYGEEVYTEVLDYNQRNFSGFSSLVRMTFDKALAGFSDGSVDLLHIDGLHTYEAVRHDFETWEPKLSDRSVVLFHDTAERQRDFGVWRFWEEASRRHDAFEFLHSHGLGVLIFGKNAPAAFRELSGLKGGDRRFVQVYFEALGGRVSIAGLRSQINERERPLEERERLLGAREGQLSSEEAALRIARRIVRLRNRWAPAGTLRRRMVSSARRLLQL